MPKIKFFFCFVFLVPLTLLAQERKLLKRDTSIAVSLDTFKAHKGIIDSTGFFAHGNDTLVQTSRKTAHIQERAMVPYEFKDSVFLETYKKIVYNSSRDSLSKTKTSMRLWKDKLKIYFDESVDSLTISAFKKFATPIDTAIDSLRISYVDTKEESNYHIYYTNKKYPINHNNNVKSKAGFYVSWDRFQFIYACSLRIDSDSYTGFEYRMRILKKRFIQTLGYFYLQNQMEGNESLFSSDYRVIPEKLTKKDLELLQYHYSYGICKGTNLQTFEEQHKMSKKSLQEYPDRKLFIIHPKRE